MHQAAARRLLARIAHGRPRLRADARAAQRHARRQPRSFDALDALLSQQSYRLASWRVAREEINYRRFFDVNSWRRCAWRSPSSSSDAHARARSAGSPRAPVQALRLDHTDGLYDPLAYFESLQRLFKGTMGLDTSAAPDDASRPLPILVEKILGAFEKLPSEWPVDGTTGYEFAASAIGVTIDRDAERRAHRPLP